MTTRPKRNAFDRLSAYAILWGPTPVARVAIHHPTIDRLRRAVARVAWSNLPYTQARASDGVGIVINSPTGACIGAAHKMPSDLPDNFPIEDRAIYRVFITALRQGDGWDWTQRLQRAGFTVAQAL